MTMTYALIIYGPDGAQTHEHVFDPEVEGEVCDGHSLCGKAMSWGDRLMGSTLAERGTPPCPDCLAAYAALRLRTEDGPVCWNCNGDGATYGGPLDDARRCPI